MNSEELELSLRTEFENYLKNVFAEMKQETAAFQERIQADFDKHRSQLDEAFQGFATRFDADSSFDQGFRESVTEHLRLARDEGAALAANAVAAAEQLDVDTAAAAAAPQDFTGIRDAIAEISGKTSQSSILKALVTEASQFAPRGAFFIIKNEQFVGWKLFGDETDGVESSIREIHIATSANSILSDAVSSRSTTEGSYGSHADDADFLTQLDFGQPGQMYAVPLVARGRGVAVMYADRGSDGGGTVNVEALETIVRIAGLTVELLAASQAAKPEDSAGLTADFEDTQPDTDMGASQDVSGYPPVAEYEPAPEYAPVEDHQAEADHGDFAFSDSVSYEGGFDQPSAYEPVAETVPEPEPEPAVSSAFEDELRSFEPAEAETPEVEEEPVHSFEPAAYDEFSSTISNTEAALTFDSGGSIEPAAFESSPFDHAANEFESTSMSNGGAAAPTADPVVEAVSAPAAGGQARLSDRPVDLPIEVPEEERRSHNDARRFARLLVSEIKLYNEKKVQEGRDAGDLYDRLREAIDRSREMYDKRVQQPVAAKFDYFHYELVNALAEGDEHRLGNSYPGASV